MLRTKFTEDAEKEAEMWKENWDIEEQNKIKGDLKRRKYSEVVKKNYMPLASERKHKDLIHELKQPSNPMSKIVGHTSIL